MNINRSLIKNRNCEICGLNLQRNVADITNNYVDVTFKENEELKTLRFLNTSQVEVESRYSDDDKELQITDCTDHGMELVKLRISGSIHGIGNFSFWAQNLTEIST